ncbi:START-like domain-containing protein [Eisenibacter elegans]|jgi:uncharacterized protein YndB with AHSA1/START domain|uniref:START-like domain-containing protein n=1 Tax=Eisenibacter elegans TaxID=997 RepID=UPI00047B3896|nr:START-like domain-containing protein [Eisenibacter elegans]
MSKFKYTQEFELKASARMLFPYLSTASGLQTWFADSVRELGQKKLHFVWDNEDHYAKVVVMRSNKQIKFEFENTETEDDSSPAYIELRLQENEMTNTTFLKVVDYSEVSDENDLDSLWEGLVHQLREIVGG